MTDFFVEKAADWDQPQKIKMAENFVAEIRRRIDLNPEWKALEIGAGTGLVGLMLLPEIHSIVFEDTSESMLNVLKQKTVGMNNIEIVHGEVTDYKQQDIDLVISNMAFHHIEDIPGALKHLYTITKPGALLFIGDIRTEDGSFHRFQAIPHQGFDTDQLSQQFEQAGFNVKEVKTYHVLQQEKIPGTISEYEQFILIAGRMN
ncbi:MAG: class I SAM-dependent DNA methyltransferase [Paludibacteraceae bacterium]